MSSALVDFCLRLRDPTILLKQPADSWCGSWGFTEHTVHVRRKIIPLSCLPEIESSRLGDHFLLEYVSSILLG